MYIPLYMLKAFSMVFSLKYLLYSIDVLMVQVSAGDFNGHCSSGCHLLAGSTQLQCQ